YNTRLEALKGVTNFITRADEDYVVLTDCDGIFRLDYNEVIEEHINTKADITLVYKNMPTSKGCVDEITSFDIENKRIVNINNSVKPSGERNNVFMNVLVMKKNVLYNIVMESIAQNKKHLMADVITGSLKNLKIYGYEHKGYYAGITSIQKYYESNLELLNPKVRHELFEDRSVFTKIRDSAPTKYGNTSIVKNSLIADGCEIEGEVENSIVFRNVKIARGAKIKNSIVMQNSVIGENATLNCIICDKDVVVRDKRMLSGSENHPFYISKNTMI
ncbi:MAG: glucose-1-phosphate adenylyltransferase subunit GlgD, partial [Clostridia bacterium]|nr:glucose-1-phosphate adenylyltransferase subunit GlgD [Clostridia bacterium]